MSIVGHVESLWRHPVKSMRGEELDTSYMGFSGVAVDVETPSGNIVRPVYGLPATFDGPNMSASYRAKAARLPLSNFYWNELARGALPEKGSPLRARLRDNLRTRRANPYTWTCAPMAGIGSASGNA
jgi:hypothetical protein